MTINLSNKTFLAASLLVSAFPLSSMAHDDHLHGHIHGQTNYEGMLLELEGGKTTNGDSLVAWEVDGWMGDEYNKLGLKSEGSREDGHLEEAEVWALYSRNISRTWDLQLGWRFDFKPHSLNQLLFGLDGLTSQHIETQVHLFVSEDGDVSARAHFEKDFFIHEQLILEPSLEANVYFQDVQEQEVGAGLSSIEGGLQLRYAYSKNFSPFIRVAFEQKFGKTSSYAKAMGERNREASATIGFRFLF